MPFGIETTSEIVASQNMSSLRPGSPDHGMHFLDEVSGLYLYTWPETRAWS